MLAKGVDDAEALMDFRVKSVEGCRRAIPGQRLRNIVNDMI